MSGTTPLQALPYPTGTDSPAGHSEVQALAVALEPKLVMIFASAASRSAAITSPTEGMLCWLNDVNRYEFHNGSAWQPLAAAAYSSYTPAWTAATSNPSIGNGTITGAYMQTGKMVHCWGSITMGSTTTYGSGAYRVSLPVAADAAFVQPLSGLYLRDLGTNDYLVAAGTMITSTTFGVAIANTAIPSNLSWQQGTPFTLGTGDTFRWNFVYPAA